MSLYIFDTDSMTHYQYGNVLLLQNTMRHIGHTFAVSAITVEEQLVGWQSALRQAKDLARITPDFIRGYTTDRPTDSE